METQNLFGHTSPETALEVKDYPWGFRLRTSKFYWIETDPKRGDRLCTQTIDPKTGRKCAPKKSNYYPVGVMTRNPENGHIHWSVIGSYDASKSQAFEDHFGKENFNAYQMKQLKQLRGEKVVEVDSFGEVKKDWSIKWKDDYGPRITFDRPDGVSAKEIFEALRSLNQDKLNEAFAGSNSRTFGHIEGFIRICVRKGHQLTTVRKEEYQEYLASDHVAKETVNA